MTYICPRGCCSVQLGAYGSRGVQRDVYVNGERGTYATTGDRLGLSAIAVYHRVENRHCLRDTPAEISARRARKRVERQASKPSGLANRFLRLPRPGVGV